MSYSLTALNEKGIPGLLEGIDSPSQWQEKRQNILRTWLDYIGYLPDRQKIAWELLSEVKLGDHYRQHIRYATAYGDHVTAYLLLPLRFKEKPDGSSAANLFPGMLALHPTNIEGKVDSGTDEGSNKVNYRYGLELVRRDYVVLVPDAITYGERIFKEAKHTAPFYEKYPEWTAVGKMLIDHIYGVDLLCSLERVDSGRIGAIGHSLGGYNAFFLAGLDHRIGAFVSSCGFATFAGDPRPNRWGLRDWFSHIPRLTPDIEQGEVPFEFNEIAALTAPIPAFYWSGQQDKIFPHWKEISLAMEDVKKLYSFLGEAEKFTYLMGTEGHDLPDYIRIAAYDFFDRWLKPVNIAE